MIIEASLVARNAVRQTYTHVFLDEFQDCTAEQYRLILACFGGTSTILTAVGDTKQSIMGWAGALEGIFQTFSVAFDALPRNLYQNFRSAPGLRRMQNAMVKVMDPPAALDDADIVGDEGEIGILRFDDDGDEAAGLTERIRGLIDDGVEPSEIAILVSKQQNLYCQRLTAAFEAAEIPFRQEDKEQDLASEPVACLLIDFLLIASGSRQPAAYRRLLDLVVFNHGYDEEREYQLRSRWDRFVTETKRQIAAYEIDLRHINGLQTRYGTDRCGWPRQSHRAVAGLCVRRSPRSTDQPGTRTRASAATKRRGSDNSLGLLFWRQRCPHHVGAQKQGSGV